MSEWQPARVRFVHGMKYATLPEEDLRKLSDAIVLVRPADPPPEEGSLAVQKHRMRGCNAEKFFEIKRDAIGLGIGIACEHEIFTD